MSGEQRRPALHSKCSAQVGRSLKKQMQWFSSVFLQFRWLFTTVLLRLRRLPHVHRRLGARWWLYQVMNAFLRDCNLHYRDLNSLYWGLVSAVTAGVTGECIPNRCHWMGFCVGHPNIPDLLGRWFGKRLVCEGEMPTCPLLGTASHYTPFSYLTMGHFQTKLGTSIQTKLNAFHQVKLDEWNQPGHLSNQKQFFYNKKDYTGGIFVSCLHFL